MELKTSSETIQLKTEERFQVLDLTKGAREAVGRSEVMDGLAVVWVPHTTAAVAVNEADRELWRDLMETLKRLVPVRGSYRHNVKYAGMPGEQNAHAHILNCLLGPGVCIPIVGGELALGKWQSLIFIEMSGPRRRRVGIHVLGQ